MYKCIKNNNLLVKLHYEDAALAYVLSILQTYDSKFLFNQTDPHDVDCT